MRPSQYCCRAVGVRARLGLVHGPYPCRGERAGAGRAGPRRQTDRGPVAMTRRPVYKRDPRVDDYINALPPWQRSLCQRLRDLIHAADPELTETIKRTVQPYFVLDGNVCALLAAKDHINLFLYDGGIVPDPEHIITAGHNNKAARTISFHQGETVNAAALTTMLKQIVANNRAGGWRKLTNH